MSRHSAGDLKQMQSLPLQVKIEMTRRRIQDWHEYWDGQVYVSFSGGKDSTVLKHIVDSMYDDTPSVFVNTGLEYPEIQKFVREIKAGKYPCFNSDVEILRPEMRFDEVVKEYGYPFPSKSISRKISDAQKGLEWVMPFFDGTAKTRNGKPSFYNCQKWKYLIDSPYRFSNKCCDVMKKQPFHKYQKQTGRKPIIGTMAWESIQRQSAWMDTGCNAFEAKIPVSKPLSFWTEQDILHYIKEFDVPYCPVYGEIQIKRIEGEQAEGQIDMIDYLGCYDPEDTLETTGCDRTGCMWCGFGAHLEGYPNRFQRMKQTHPKQYEYCMNVLGLKEVLQYIGVPYE